MQALFEAIRAHATEHPDTPAFSDPNGMLTRAELLAEAADLAASLPFDARTIGIAMANGREWVIAVMACVIAGRLAVPLPPFFSAVQIGHILRDAEIDLVLTGEDAAHAATQGMLRIKVRVTGVKRSIPPCLPGFGMIIYTSGSTGRPKGVCHGGRQIAWSTRALAAAIEAGAEDSYLSVMPLSLLLETLCAVFIPALVGGRVYFDTAISSMIGAGVPTGLARSFARHRPTVSVVVPDLLRIWVGELAATQTRAPDSLRFVAVGGAKVPERVAEVAWQVGIPVHEGYGLSECCSVVAVNRPGRRVAGTVGAPLEGLSVVVRGGEIVVDGPSVMEGYLGGVPAPHPWPTGDVGTLDDNGLLTVSGRRDSLIVTSLGRNVSPEWGEAAILNDPAIALCAVADDGNGLCALIVPTSQAAGWFEASDQLSIVARLAASTPELPDYARPARAVVMSMAACASAGLLTESGRIRRSELSDVLRLFPAAP